MDWKYFGTVPELRHLPRLRQDELWKAGFYAFLRSWHSWATFGSSLVLLTAGWFLWFHKWNDSGNEVATVVILLLSFLVQNLFIRSEIRRMLAAGR